MICGIWDSLLLDIGEKLESSRINGVGPGVGPFAVRDADGRDVWFSSIEL